jgi:hypothetical protein
MKIIYCRSCNNKVKNDEIALNIKIFGKQIGAIKCYDCLAEFLNCKSSKLMELSEYYKKTRCSIFNTRYVQEEKMK